MNYSITVFGNKSTTADLVRHLKREGHDISLIVTLSPDSKDTKHISGADDLAALGKSLSIPVYATEDYKLSADKDKKFFADHQFGIGVCTGWQRLLPSHVLKAFPKGVFGFHGSCWPLPKGRGRSPLNWSMRCGGDRIYHNCFKYVEKADAGEIFNTTEFPISPFDQISSVQFKALLDMKLTSGKLLQQYQSGTIKTTVQPSGEETWLGKLCEQDGLLNFQSMSCAEILRLVNATSRPFPGAYAQTAEGVALKIWRAIPFEFPLNNAAPPGTIMDCSLGQVLIKGRDGLILATDYDCEQAVTAGLKLI